MRILIVEDETSAYDSLVDVLKTIDPHIRIMGNTESIKQTVKWLSTNPAPDLILMDIHLSDGSAFNIFKLITVEIPVIFTTAYDQYAIDAFKVNSIDYILKPVNVKSMQFALDKFQKQNKQDLKDYLTQLSKLIPSEKYIEKILIPFKDRLIPVSLTDVCFFYSTERNTQVYLKDGKSYSYSKTLESISEITDPKLFFRANKQFIIAKQSITNITIWFSNRLFISLETETPEPIYISKNKSAEFKQWMTF